MTDIIVDSPLTGRKARTGDVAEQCRSTWDTIADAIEERDAAAVDQLAAFALDQECTGIYVLLTDWAVRLRTALASRGVPEPELDAIASRLSGLLAYPDGREFDPQIGWDALTDVIGRLRSAAKAGAWDEAHALVPVACERWRVVHDRVVDASYGWMSAFVECFGEERVPEMFEEIAYEHFEECFAVADPKLRAWTDGGVDAVLLDTIEAMRIHLSTLRRDGGPIELVEHEDRWEMVFDPCGSGGRAVRGDRVEGTPSRFEQPYEFARIEGAYSWTDGKAGMCVYCNHCQQLYEQWPIDHGGMPFLVVEPPLGGHPDDVGRPDRCRYTIYKDPAAVPDEVYERCGRTRPALPVS